MKKSMKSQQSKSVYNPSLSNMHQENLFEAIQNASEQDIKNALNKNDSNHSELDQALHAFRNDFKEVAFSEKVFNPFHFLKEYESYRQDFNTNFDTKKNLFWRHGDLKPVYYTPKNLSLNKNKLK